MTYNPYAYNPYMAAYNAPQNQGYNLYAQAQQTPQATNILPPQQIIQVNGKSSIDTLQMSPNSSILIMDTSAPIVWMCISDGIGKVTATPYDIIEHKDAPPVDMQNVEQRLTAVENFMNQLIEGAKNDGKSNARNAKSKSNGAESTAD